MDKLEAIKNKLREMAKACELVEECIKCVYRRECNKIVGSCTPSDILKSIENIEKELKF